MKNTIIKILTVVLIVLIVTIVISVILAQSILDKLEEMGFIEEPIDCDAVTEQIRYEYLGQVRINPGSDEVLEEYLCMYVNSYTKEIGEREYYDYPRLFIISYETDIEYFEKVFETDIDIDLDFSRGRLYMTVGSKIDSFDVRGWVPEEFPGQENIKYDVRVRFEDEFDGNMMYFYWLETDEFGYYD